MSISFNVNVLLPVLAKDTLGAGPADVRDRHRVLRRGRARGRARRGDDRQAALAVHPRLGRGLRRRRDPDRAAAERRARRRAALRLRRLLHDLHGRLELRRPARDARPHPRPRARRLLLRVDGAAAAREPADRLALRRSAGPSSRSSSAASLLGAAAAGAVAVGSSRAGAACGRDGRVAVPDQELAGDGVDRDRVVVAVVDRHAGKDDRLRVSLRQDPGGSVANRPAERVVRRAVERGGDGETSEHGANVAAEAVLAPPEGSG